MPRLPSHCTVSERTVMTGHRIGWIGAGRMGAAIAERLLAAGNKLAVYNRTRAKAEPLVARGAR
ncbi:MAG TPA: NAD(P)-binding domain-containing protein, partial [Stellaceae bacterium]|nr:NAD(P)-binding domain-containing protein [Stellaceae bacterium]